ncbi:nucleotidyl transferase AbiEii/AbiGii toxin family protein [Isoptericola croceus]|uniref:nucleotidyl transferase AbiEii/AbiGii toxin family protein n=1 Tax=Isoptericola croceus TaxID=3031406 RepID=UPI0023F64337|nr:nucleotidyl transferase AbiEii/AbiGii toxin family protein [Isoptericola croceus]
MSKQTGRPKDALVREYAFDRLLARVFADEDERWVLKGGGALLRRVGDARYTVDVDLLRRGVTPDQAVEDLRSALERDVGDPFTFQVTRTVEVGSELQPKVRTMRVQVEMYAGTKPFPFHIDLVTGSLMTADPEAGAKIPDIVVP